ncbi:hypothetical protein H6G89_09680 [Oscillatoria sp. FACHB-1407]|uniref:hypothetical protein n=1 Tax=Oscillatoria sp. FACHB-1407 TaxID=2692847 RepID=UPI0016839AB4|nr:hypothetical protein [Oscillatoria sp. FACHB-1407]MBD2461316.1 hypothetical protein [Oscillatoria sp. FACHB-1407]
MRTPILEPKTFRGWEINLYLEKGGFSFQVKPPVPFLFDMFDDGCIYSTSAQAYAAAKRFIKVEMVSIAVERWLSEVYETDTISQAEYESLYYSLRNFQG